MTALDKRFDTGMSVGEALQRAEAWWDATGCKLIRHELVQRNATRRHPSREAFVATDAWTPTGNFLPSGIMQGKPWDDLTADEKRFVTRVWHHQFVRMEQDDGHVWTELGLCTYCGLSRQMWSAVKSKCEVAQRIIAGLDERTLVGGLRSE